MHAILYKLKALYVILSVAALAACIQGCNSETTQAETEATALENTVENGPLRTVPFLTLRNKTGSDEAKKFFGGERDTLHAGICELARTPIDSLKAFAELKSSISPIFQYGPLRDICIISIKAS